MGIEDSERSFEHFGIVDEGNRDEAVDEEPGLLPFGEQQASKVLLEFVEVIDFDDGIPVLILEYLLQFLWGEMLRISLLSMEFLAKGMNSSVFIWAKWTKFRFWMSLLWSESTSVMFSPFYVFMIFTVPFISP